MRPGSSKDAAVIVRFWSRPKRRQQLLVLVAGLGAVTAVTVVFLLIAETTTEDYWRTLGYPGVFFLSLMGSASIVLPLPGFLGVCGAGGLELNPIALGLISGLGETIGETSGYAIGYGGRSVVEGRRFYRILSRWMNRRGTLVLFLVSIIPNPFFDLIGIAAGGTQFPMRRFLVVVWVGKSIKSAAVAYACFHGVKLLPWVG